MALDIKKRKAFDADQIIGNKKNVIAINDYPEDDQNEFIWESFY